MCKDKWSDAKWLLKLSLGLKRLVGAILEPSDPNSRPDLGCGFELESKTWSSLQIAPAYVRFQACRAAPGCQFSVYLQCLHS